MKYLIRMIFKFIFLPFTLIGLFFLVFVDLSERLIDWVYEKEVDEWGREYNRKAILKMARATKFWDARINK